MLRIRYARRVGVLLAVLAAWGGVAADGPAFLRDFDRARDRAHLERKPLVVVFVAAWCPVCTSMERTVFTQPGVTALEDEFVWVLVDIDRELTLARDRGITGVPTLELLSPDGESLDRHEGLIGAGALEARLRAVADTGAPPTDAAAPGAGSDLTWLPEGYRGSGICFSHVGYGPLSVTAQSAFQSLRLGPRPRSPSTLGKGQMEWTLTGTWSNFWAVDGLIDQPDKNYFLDYESFQGTFAFGYGITDRFQLEVAYEDRSRFGGELDGLSQGFHDLFGIDQNGRDEVPRGEFRLDLDPGDGRTSVSLTPSDRGSFSRTLGLSFQHNLTCGTRRLPALAWAVTVRHDLRERDLRGGNDLDLGVSIAASRKFGRIYLYGTIGYAWFGSDDFRGLELRDAQWTTQLAVEWRFRPRASLVVQALSTEGLVDDFDPFDERSDEFTFGVKVELPKYGVLEVGLIENFISFDNTPDVGLHAGLRHRF